MLTLENCPLLDPADSRSRVVVELYNKAARQAEILRQTFPELVRDDNTLGKLLQDLEAIAADLKKSSYSIGFIGPTQSGKSTTVNYVLDAVDPKHQPCREGTGDNTTSAVSRIVRGERSLQLIYMSPREFNRKRQQLCLRAGFDPDSSNEDILRQTDQRLADVRSGGALPLATGEQILEHDVIVLKNLLTASQRFQTHITDPPLGKSEPYERRAMFVNYGKGADPANPLLREARIGFDSRFLSEKLHIFDLPGPGARSSIDGWITQQFLPSMDGIMLFLNCTKLGDESVERLFNDLRQRFGLRTGQRVWIVLTRWDSPTSASLDGYGEDSVFTGIRTFIEDKKIEIGQVRFVCGPWYTTPDCEAFVKAHFQGRLGAERIPNGLQQCPDFMPYFEELKRLGGIPSLRQLILETLPRDVCSEILDSAEGSLKRLCRDLLKRFENEVRRQTASAQQSATAAQFSSKMGRLVIDLERDLTTFEPHALDLRNKLSSSFDSVCAPADVLDHFDSVPKDFPVHAKNLQSELLRQLESHLIPELFSAWQPKFDEFSGLQVRGPVSGEPVSIGDAWREYLQHENSEIAIHAARIPSFNDNRLFAAVDDATVAELRRGDVYREMMQEKILLMAQQVVHFVRNRLVLHAKALLSDLDQLTRSDANSTPVAAGRFAAVLEEMKGLAG